MSLRILNILNETLTQGGAVIYDESESGGSPIISNRGMISERKRLTVTFNNDVEPDGVTLQTLAHALLYVNFALFLPLGFIYSSPTGPPNTGFNLKLPATLVGSERIEMFFYSNGNTTLNTSKNLRCFFIGAASHTDVTTQFGIEFEYYNTYDENTYFNNASKNNQWRFLSESVDKQSFEVVPDSVYNSEKELRANVYLQSNIITSTEFTLLQQQNLSFNSTGKFSFGTSTFTEFNKGSDTPVTILIPDSFALSDFYVKLIKDKNDTSLDFISNYDLQENKIDPGSSDNVFKGPFVKDVVSIDGESYYELQFNIDYTLIDPNTNYRLLVVAYDFYSTDTIGLLSSTITPTLVNPYNGSGFNIGGSLSDLQREFFGDELTCVIEERIKTKLYIDYSFNSYAADILNRLGEIIPNDIRYYLQAVKLEIYQEYYDSNVAGTVHLTLEESILNKVAYNTYQGNGIIATFNVDNAEIEYTFRNRDDAGSQPLSQTVNNVAYFNIYNPLGNQYWGGKDLFIKWRLIFNYPTFQDNVDYIQKIHIKDYDEAIVIERIGSTKYYVCDADDNLCYTAQVTSGVPDYNTSEWLLINTIESLVLPLQESEEWPTIEIPGQISPYLYDQSYTYNQSGIKAEFCIHNEMLTVNQSFKFSAMAKKDYTY